MDKKIETPLRRARRANNWTLDDLSARTGLDVSQLSRIERGYNTTPESAEKLAALFPGKLTEIEILYPKRKKKTA